MIFLIRKGVIVMVANILTFSPFFIHAQEYTATSEGQYVQYSEFSLMYSEKYEQPLWVGYDLERDEIYMPSRKRLDYFYVDKNIVTGSASYTDYTNSGYDRGHLSRASYNKRSEESYKESYYMSNISPQLPGFNRKGGTWYRLEDIEINITKVVGKLHCFSGPIFSEKGLKRIGENEVGVPEKFYKVMYDSSSGKGFGIIVEHNEQSVDPFGYVVSVKEVEDLTGIDFYSNMEDQSWEGDKVSWKYFFELVKNR